MQDAAILTIQVLIVGLIVMYQGRTYKATEPESIPEPEVVHAQRPRHEMPPPVATEHPGPNPHEEGPLIHQQVHDYRCA